MPIKQIVPYYPLYVPTPREDYFAVCAEAAGGPIVSLQPLSAGARLRALWREDLHVHGRGLPLPELSSLLGRRTIYNFYNNFIGQGRVAILARRWLFNRCAKVIVHSEFARRNYIAQGIHPGKLVLLPIPVDVPYFSTPADPQRFRDQFNLGTRPFAIAVGIRYHKNPMVMVEACLKIGLPLVLVGFKERSETRHWGAGFLPEDRLLQLQHPLIIKTGYLSTEDLRNAYQAANVYLNSSESDGEVFCIAAYEAALGGCPLCLPDYGTFEVFQGAALFHSNRDSAGLSANIRAILDDPAAARRRGETAKRVARGYDYADVLKTYQQFYAALGASRV